MQCSQLLTIATNTPMLLLCSTSSKRERLRKIAILWRSRSMRWWWWWWWRRITRLTWPAVMVAYINPIQQEQVTKSAGFCCLCRGHTHTHTQALLDWRCTRTFSRCRLGLIDLMESFAGNTEDPFWHALLHRALELPRPGGVDVRSDRGVSVENFITVMLVTFRFKQLRQPLNYIIVNLSLADFLVSASGGTISFLTNYQGYFFLGRWALFGGIRGHLFW